MNWFQKVIDWFRNTFQPGTHNSTSQQMKEQGGESAHSVVYGSENPFWDDLTGKSNTNATNSATAALQEDAQAHQYNMTMMDYAWKEEQAEIERQRADTAVQRQVADLQAAGLNPWLAAGANGAGSPGVPNSTMAGTSANSAINATKSGVDMLSAATNAAVSAALIWKIFKTVAK